MTNNVVVSVLRAKFVKKLMILPDIIGIKYAGDVGWKVEATCEGITVRS